MIRRPEHVAHVRELLKLDFRTTTESNKKNAPRARHQAPIRGRELE